jgi:hypothetical protein
LARGSAPALQRRRRQIHRLRLGPCRAPIWNRRPPRRRRLPIRRLRLPLLRIPRRRRRIRRRPLLRNPYPRRPRPNPNLPAPARWVSLGSRAPRALLPAPRPVLRVRLPPLQVGVNLAAPVRDRALPTAAAAARLAFRAEP